MKKENKIFTTLQKIGGSLMLPISLLPIAGLCLGIGSSFTNEVTLKAYNLAGILGEGTVLGTILLLMKSTGDIIFANLPMLFAIGIAVGLANREKHVAGIAAFIGFVVMHQTIHMLLDMNGMLAEGAMPDGALGSILGINSLQMGVFGGLVVGLIVPWLHNKFYQIKLPDMLSYFGGVRFVPIITVPTFIIIGALLFIIWPHIQNVLTLVSGFVNSSGAIGMFVFGIITRSLVPLGLHHIIQVPFWNTALGGTMMIDGVSVSGGQNIIFAQLSSPNTKQFSVDAAKYMQGFFPMMLGGLPGAALALYHTAKPENKKAIVGLLLSSTLTIIATGITEPLEFSFLFVAPILYGVHVIFTGISFMMMYVLNVAVGLSFSGSIIDFILFGVLPGNDKTHWMNAVLIAVALFPMYYFSFKFLILKLNLKTPGREDNVEDVKLYTKKDVQEKNKASERAKAIVEGLGGKANIVTITNCASRLRVEVKDPTLVNEATLKSTGANGILKKENNIQVIYGPAVVNIKVEVDNFIESL